MGIDIPNPEQFDELARQLLRERLDYEIMAQREQHKKWLNRQLQCPDCRRIIQRRDRYMNQNPTFFTLPERVVKGEVCAPCGQKRLESYQRICDGCGTIYYRWTLDTETLDCSDCQPLNEDVEYDRVMRQNSRARDVGAVATLTVDEWLRTLDDFHYLCAYCQGHRFQAMDHFIPLGVGGATSAQNCVPVCHTCNSQKGPTNPLHFHSNVGPSAIDRVRAYLATR